MFRITCINRNRQDDRRDDAEVNRWSETMKRKEEAGHSRRDCRNQEPFRPAIETFAGQQPKQNHESSKNSDQTDQRVNQSIDPQYHNAAITRLRAGNVTLRFSDAASRSG